jgi:hypothetical protein
MAFRYQSLRDALSGHGMTQQQLANAVTKLRRRRQNGKLLKLSQNFTSQLVNEERRAGTDIAKAICFVLDDELDPRRLVFGPDGDGVKRTARNAA